MCDILSIQAPARAEYRRKEECPMTLEQRAHDLAILYMQLEIKHGQIIPAEDDDFQGFVDEYQNCYSEILQQLNENA